MNRQATIEKNLKRLRDLKLEPTRAEEDANGLDWRGLEKRFKKQNMSGPWKGLYKDEIELQELVSQGHASQKEAQEIFDRGPNKTTCGVGTLVPNTKIRFGSFNPICNCESCNPIDDFKPKYKKEKKMEETLILWDVWLIYGEDRNLPIVFRKEGVLADNEENAKIKSGLMKKVDNSWDTDYVTFFAHSVHEVSVKAKLKEVLSVGK